MTFDAGTLVNGLRVADEKGAFDSVKVPAEFGPSAASATCSPRIKGYLVSHAHLDQWRAW